jgi:hypothetical protein
MKYCQQLTIVKINEIKNVNKPNNNMIGFDKWKNFNKSNDDLTELVSNFCARAVLDAMG